MSFNFPDPAVSTTATNPVTGAQYQWKADPGKWVLTGGAAAVAPPVTIDLLPPESPQVGDLWIHQESLIEYAWDGTQWFEVGSSCGGASEDEKLEDYNVPFTNSYKLLSPDNFTGADGTATLETDAYANGDDSFLSPSVEIARFAERDLNGKKHEGVNINESFQLAPTTYETSDIIKPAYGIFKVTSLEGSTGYSVDYDNSRAFRFIEGDTIYYRPSFTGDYVKKKGGDTMEGPLHVTGNRNAGADGLEGTVKAKNIDSGENSSLQLKHNGNTRVYVGDSDFTLIPNLKFNGGNKSIYSGNDKKGFTVTATGVFYEGAYLDNKHVATKKDVEEAIFHDITDDTTNKFVKRSGDTMAGNLTMEDAKIQFNADDLNTNYIDFKRPNGEYITAINFSNNNDVASQEGGYEVHLGGFTSYNRLRLTGRNSTSEPNMFEARADGVMTFLKNVSFDNNRITDLGDATQDTDAVPYGQVKRELQDKFDEYVDTISFGTYTYTISMSPNDGFFAAYSNGGTSHIPSQIDQLWIAKKNNTGDDIGLDSLAPGDLIRWAQGTDLYQFRVNGTPSDKGAFYEIEVNKGVGPGNLTVSSNFDISLIKLTGGSVNLDEYVKKAGDTMTGNLEINRTGADDQEAAIVLKGKRPSTTNSVATIAFQNNTNTTIGYLTYRASGTTGFFKFNRDVEFNNNKLLDVNQIDFTSPGILKVDGNDALTIRRAANGNDGNANFQVPRAPNARRTFAIKGKDPEGTERDVLYCYANPSGGDAINYHGIQTGDSHIATVGKIKELIAGGGDANGEIIQRHGPFLFAGINSAVSPGQFSTDVGPLKQIRQITFNRTNNDGEDDFWSDLAPGEVFTVGQSDGANYFVVNYTVKLLTHFTSATIIDVDATQTVVSYSDGNVVYNPADAFGFISNTDTFGLESQPATLNGASVLAQKASPAPAFHSFRLNSNQTEPIIGVPRGQMVFSGGATIQDPGAIIVSGYDRYGNGIQNGSNSFDCPGSILEVHRRNLDGSTILCRIYQFDRLVSVASGVKITYRTLTLLYKATNGTPAVPDPGTMEAGADYLLKQQINFSASAFIIDAEGDPHFENHRLEDVGVPVAATDAATKGYVDSKFNFSQYTELS